MIIAGLQKQSLIEYPGRISAIIFLAGCNLRCQFCYVPHLVLPEEIKKIKPISENKIFSFLKERKGFLEAVSISGGEPTLNPQLPKFIEKIKNLKYLVELETNGTNPKMLKELIDKRLVDYVAMDIKHQLVFEKYNEITGKVLTKKTFKSIKESIGILLEGKVDYEFRTTLVPSLIDKKDIFEIAQWISGAKKYYLQNFRPQKTIDPIFEKIKPYPEKYLLEIQKALSPFFETCQIR